PKDLANAGDRAAGANARDEGVETAAGVVEDLERSGAAVDVRVGRGVELLGHEVAPVLLYHVLGGGDGAGHAFDSGREDELGAEALKEATALVAVVVGHREDDFVALDGADEGEADAGVAAGRLDDGVARLEEAAGLGVLDHAEGDAVLDAAAGVPGLDLGDDLSGADGPQAVEPDEGRLAHEVKDAVGDLLLALHRTG